MLLPTRVLLISPAVKTVMWTRTRRLWGCASCIVLNLFAQLVAHDLGGKVLPEGVEEVKLHVKVPILDTVHRLRGRFPDSGRKEVGRGCKRCKKDEGRRSRCREVGAILKDSGNDAAHHPESTPPHSGESSLSQKSATSESEEGFSSVATSAMEPLMMAHVVKRPPGPCHANPAMAAPSSLQSCKRLLSERNESPSAGSGVTPLCVPTKPLDSAESSSSQYRGPFSSERSDNRLDKTKVLHYPVQATTTDQLPSGGRSRRTERCIDQGSALRCLVQVAAAHLAAETLVGLGEASGEFSSRSSQSSRLPPSGSKKLSAVKLMLLIHRVHQAKNLGQLPCNACYQEARSLVGIRRANGDSFKMEDLYEIGKSQKQKTRVPTGSWSERPCAFHKKYPSEGPSACDKHLEIFTTLLRCLCAKMHLGAELSRQKKTSLTPLTRARLNRFRSECETAMFSLGGEEGVTSCRNSRCAAMEKDFGEILQLLTKWETRLSRIGTSQGSTTSGYTGSVGGAKLRSVLRK